MKKTFTLVFSLLCSVLCFAQKPQVVLMGAVETQYLEDVKTKLENTNRFSKVEIFNINDSTPTYSYVKEYNAILLFTDDGANDPEALGDTLGKYIENGGGVVNAVFTNASASIGGLFHQSYQVLEADDQEDGTEYTLDPEFDSSHPLMSDVSTFIGGASSYRSTSSTITTGSEIIAKWSDGAPLVIVNDNMGPANAKRVDLNFYPVSSDIRYDFWDSSTDGATMIANALVYVNKNAVTTIKKPSSITIADVYPNPSSGKFSIPLHSKTADTYQVKVLTVYGKEVFSTEQSVSIGLNILDMNLIIEKGMYVVEVIDNNSSVSKKIVIE